MFVREAVVRSHLLRMIISGNRRRDSINCDVEFSKSLGLSNFRELLARSSREIENRINFNIGITHAIIVVT